MLTKVISLKDYRQNITSLWKEAKKNNVCYVVLHHSKPILEVKPFPEEELIFEGQTFEEINKNNYYRTLDQTLDFWNNPADDNIFKI